MSSSTRNRRTALAALGAALACAFTASVPGRAAGGLPAWLDPGRREEARAAARGNPLGLPLRDRANREAASLGFSEDDSFELLGAHRDERGGTHARLRQLHRGVPVERAILIAHTDEAGSPLPYTDAGIRGIRTPDEPSLSAADAIRSVEADPRCLFPWADAPRTELVYLPLFEHVLRRTGDPAPPPRYDPDVEDAMVEPVDATDVVKRVTEVSLAWRVVGVELDPAEGRYFPRAWYVDAHRGSVLDVRELSREVVGSGLGRWNGAVTFETRAVGQCSIMEDMSRAFTTMTEDFDDDEPVNCDADNDWGDGMVFAGDAIASNANWQTAMVDGHFGATVYWNLMDKVFNLQGPDDDYYSVNVFMHHLTNHNNAHYHSLSGNVSFGDGPNDRRTRLDCLGHELGHAWNDHNTGYDGDADALNESLGDVFGEWTDAYLASGGFAQSLSTVGAVTDANWINNCSGRNLVSPAKNNHPSYWYSSILSAEEHEGSAPASRAFAFLARGASPRIRDASYSREITWGMTGLGLQSAARIFYRAHATFIADHDYQGLRKGMLEAADHLFGALSAEMDAVRNAYAAINVGAPSALMPAPPPFAAELEPNDSTASAQNLGVGMSPPPGAVSGAPRKVRLLGSGDDDDVYTVSVLGNYLTVLITPLVPVQDMGELAVQILTPSGTLLKEVPASNKPQKVDYTFFNVTGKARFVIRVVPQPPIIDAPYQLDVDLGL
jgi:Zn-dependent metalloprotease